MADNHDALKEFITRAYYLFSGKDEEEFFRRIAEPEYRKAYCVMFTRWCTQCSTCTGRGHRAGQCETYDLFKDKTGNTPVANSIWAEMLNEHEKSLNCHRNG